jgi:hypothetical protein
MRLAGKAKRSGLQKLRKCVTAVAFVSMVLRSAPRIGAHDSGTTGKLSEKHSALVSVQETTKLRQEHRFWDKENGWLIAGAVASIGASYLFHHSGHHKLERWTAIVHIGLTTSGAVGNDCLKTAPPNTSP